LANVEITLNTEKDALDFKANYGAKGVSASASFNYLKNTSSASSTANVYVVGGPLNTSIFETDKLQQQITELISRCNYQTAKPIAYSFSDINGNILGIESVTDKFTTKKCVPKGSVFKLKLAKVSIMTGNDTKEQGSNAIISLTNSNNMVVFENSNNNIEFKNSNDVVLNARALPTSYNDQFLETAFSTNGGYIDIFLEPKPVLFAWDDWQIRSVNVVFIFEDQYKAIQHRQFNFNASVYLKKDQQRVRLPFDGMFNAGGVFMPGL
tara:strand:+ start:856 stop:1653 length:798 start_codon:yes stop_codon:yes gene_type:complete